MNKFFKLLISFILVFFLSCNDTFSLNGFIMYNHKGVDGIKVILKSPHFSDESITDENGKFKFERLLSGKYEIETSMEGFTIIPDNYSFSIEVNKNLKEINFTAFNNALTPLTFINQVQGSSHISPMNGMAVENVIGVVSAIKGDSGFYIQSPLCDKNPMTSEGLYIYNGSRPDVTKGDWVLIDGYVKEYGFGMGLSTTEIIKPSTRIIKNGRLPAAIKIGPEGRMPPGSIICDDSIYEFDPEEDGIDFYESLEGMRVEIPGAIALGTVNAMYGEFFVLPSRGKGASVVSERGGIVLRDGDLNPERICIDYNEKENIIKQPSNINVSTGCIFINPIIGIMDYSFYNYKVLPDHILPGLIPADLEREESKLSSLKNTITISSFNVMNLSAKDSRKKFNDIAATIVSGINLPDILGLIEIQDNDGKKESEVVSADETYERLINEISIISNSECMYDYRDIPPEDDADGGITGGNIRAGFLFRQDRVQFVDIEGGDSITGTEVYQKGDQADISTSPGRIDPGNAAFLKGRKPIIGKFIFNNEPIFVIVNHFKSKHDDDPLYGSQQLPIQASEPIRIEQAKAVHDFTKKILSFQPDARVAVIGDMNDFYFSKTLSVLKGDILMDTGDKIPVNDRYTYIYEGNAQQLDYILVSKKLYSENIGIDIVHRYSEYLYKDRHADHDPILGSFMMNSF